MSTENTESTRNTDLEQYLSKEDIKPLKKLQDLIKEKRETEYRIQELKNNGLQILKRRKYYELRDNLLEHIGYYKDYGIFLKIQKIEFQKDFMDVKVTLVKRNEIKYLKKKNKKQIEKLNLRKLNEVDLYPLFLKVVKSIESINEGV